MRMHEEWSESTKHVAKGKRERELWKSVFSYTRDARELKRDATDHRADMQGESRGYGTADCKRGAKTTRLEKMATQSGIMYSFRIH